MSEASPKIESDWLDTDAAFDHAVQPLWGFLSVHDPLEPSDAIFLFGGPYAEAATQAARLYQRGLAPTILVTGNRGTGSGHFEGNSEAEYFGRRIIEQGIDRSAVILEERATNTGENVSFGMAALCAVRPPPRQLIIIASPAHLRRCVATFAKQFPDLKILSCPPPGQPSHFAQQYSRRRVAERLVEEVDRLRRYPSLGYIATVLIPDHVQTLEKTLRQRLQGK